MRETRLLMGMPITVHICTAAGGDIQSCGRNASGLDWSVGIRNPFNTHEIIKVVYPRGRGVATSGTYARGQHIYNPFAIGDPVSEIVSLTVVAEDVCEADRFATAAFAMGRDGILFLEQRPGLEGYMVDSNGRATPTSGFGAFCRQ
jgi:thiamine biosynthesis lipoprotein